MPATDGGGSAATNGGGAARAITPRVFAGNRTLAERILLSWWIVGKHMSSEAGGGLGS